MAQYVTLEELKRALHLEGLELHDEELLGIIDDAEGVVIAATDYPEEDFRRIPKESLPGPLHRAMLRLAIYDWNDKGETQSDLYIQLALAPVRPYQRMAGGSRLQAIIDRYAPGEGSVE